MRLYNLLSSTSQDSLLESKRHNRLVGMMDIETLEEISPEIAKYWERRVWNARDIIKKEPYVIWYLRYTQVIILDKISKSRSIMGDPETRKLALEFIKRGFSRLTPLIASEDSNSLTSLREKAGNVVGFINYLGHYANHPSPEIQAYRIGRKSYGQVSSELRKLDQKWKETSGRDIDMSKSDAEQLIRFPDGYAWFDLKKPECRDEANAMGHCGNAGGGGTVLSLRKRDPNRRNMWVPHLTFILHEGGILGEMKGRGNDKPAPKYHPYILELLKQNFVTDIMGGGYKPENNFSVSDLEGEDRKNLARTKPILMDPLSASELLPRDQFIQYIRNKTDDHIWGDYTASEIPIEVRGTVPENYVALGPKDGPMFDIVKFIKTFGGEHGEEYAHYLDDSNPVDELEEDDKEIYLYRIARNKDNPVFPILSRLHKETAPGTPFGEWIRMDGDIQWTLVTALEEMRHEIRAGNARKWVNMYINTIMEDPPFMFRGVLADHFDLWMSKDHSKVCICVDGIKYVEAVDSKNRREGAQYPVPLKFQPMERRPLHDFSWDILKNQVEDHFQKMGFM